MKNKNEEINKILSKIGKYISNEEDPPVEAFLELKSVVEKETHSYDDYIQSIELNKKYEKVLSVLMDYITKYLNEEAKHSIRTESIVRSSLYDGVELQDVNFHEIIIPEVRLTFMDGISKPISKQYLRK